MREADHRQSVHIQSGAHLESNNLAIIQSKLQIISRESILTFSRPKTLMRTPPSNIGCESIAVMALSIFWNVRLYKVSGYRLVGVTLMISNGDSPGASRGFWRHLESVDLRRSWMTIRSEKLEIASDEQRFTCKQSRYQPAKPIGIFQKCSTHLRNQARFIGNCWPTYIVHVDQWVPLGWIVE
jgi:hypothetical protein